MHNALSLVFGAIVKDKKSYYLKLSDISQQHLSQHFSALWSWVYVCLIPAVQYGTCLNPGKQMMMVMVMMKTSVCPCVEVMFSCLCTSSYSLFALNDQRRSNTGRMFAATSRQSQAILWTSNVCDICCTCVYFQKKKFNKCSFYDHVHMSQELLFCIY